ncbi:hypothetical protein OS493_037782 [Desmophyllum pertusum]|uniref:Ciliary microtubule inner protein 2C n=1 Tax=Desmophyllum pertusum TaxID=174260 RepID=A0A9W9YJ47_9CNID|nr:hypothetical protein OS493_037782 [Desmophyllum pertusum]
MLSPGTTNLTTFQNPKHMPGYAGYCPQAKFWHYGDTFGNTTAKYMHERRTAKLNSSVMKQPGISGDGRTEFPLCTPIHPTLCSLPGREQGNDGKMPRNTRYSTSTNEDGK